MRVVPPSWRTVAFMDFKRYDPTARKWLSERSPKSPLAQWLLKRRAVRLRLGVLRKRRLKALQMLDRVGLRAQKQEHVRMSSSLWDCGQTMWRKERTAQSSYRAPSCHCWPVFGFAVNYIFQNCQIVQTMIFHYTVIWKSLNPFSQW